MEISTRLNTEKDESRIHMKAMVDSIVGTMNGSSITARTRFFIEKVWFITRAGPKRQINFRMVAVIV